MKVLQRQFWYDEPHARPLPDRPIWIDGFAGGGGASVGLSRALGRSVDVAINHDPSAIAMHMANHADTRHYCENLWDIDPVEACDGRPIDGAWFSPDCTHFSKARGEKPVAKKIRGLAWVVVRWAELVRPRLIFVENVEEFANWGPVNRHTNQPIKEKAGITFKLWVEKLKELGYDVDWRVRRASDYGSPTTRRRLFIVARRDGQPIRWPDPTHGGPREIARDLRTQGYSRRQKCRTAAEIIDWSIECPSIFLSPEEAKAKGCRRPLADKTMRRIAEGIRRYVIECPRPFIVKVSHGSDHFRGQNLDRPLSTVTMRNGYAVADPVVAPFSLSLQHGGRSRSLHDPHRTITASPKDCNVVVSPTLISYYGPRPGDNGHRGRTLNDPLPTQTVENRFGLVAAFIAKHYGGVVGVDARTPFPTVTMRGTQNQVVTSHLLKLRGTSRDGQPVTEPAPAITSGGNHVAEVRAFLMRYYSQGGQWSAVDRPLPTITSHDRLCLGVVMIGQSPYQIVDIGMRMLTPRELFSAQGFPSDYAITTGVNGKPATKKEMVARCGNSVPPQVVEAIVRANIHEEN